MTLSQFRSKLYALAKILGFGRAHTQGRKQTWF